MQYHRFIGEDVLHIWQDRQGVLVDVLPGVNTLLGVKFKDRPCVVYLPVSDLALIKTYPVSRWPR